MNLNFLMVSREKTMFLKNEQNIRLVFIVKIKLFLLDDQVTFLLP